MGLVIGIVQDAVTTQFMGISPLSYVITCFIIGKLGNFYPVSSRWTWIGWLLGGTILQSIIYFYFYASGADLSFWSLMLNYALPGAATTTVVGALWSLSPWWRPTERRGTGLLD
jgi:cell shape-determining protein MreD